MKLSIVVDEREECLPGMTLWSSGIRGWEEKTRIGGENAWRKVCVCGGRSMIQVAIDAVWQEAVTEPECFDIHAP